MSPSPYLRLTEKGVLLKISVQPKASRNELAGVHEESLKIRLTSPPVEGEANRECIKFISKLLGVSKSAVEILHGHKSRRKVLLIHGLEPEAIELALERWTP